ncbi:MAG: hypothetical protein EZS28_040313 [Streblomastix strix]|uniref:Uncharacterized protein n=1 Tax=Streblomastix strix TaxID=222440 RepID=A0A5J4U1J1_9EUKA|nr:MAG: hypothetical protein EZS28_040313 [Streblomastix strix]
MSEVNSKQTNYVSTTTIQEINGSKTFNANVNSTGFVKTGKNDISVLLAYGGDALISQFGEIENLTFSAFSGIYNAGIFNPDYLVQDDVSVAIHIPFPNHTVDKGELYAYIKERQHKPIDEQHQPMLIRDQILQLQMKNNDDIFYGSGDGQNEAFVPPVPNAIMKLDLSLQLE